MYHLVDTLNRKILSSHRTVEAAEFADEKYQRAVRRANGEGSYVPTCIAKGTEAEMRTSMDLAVLNNWSKNFMREALDCR